MRVQQHHVAVGIFDVEALGISKATPTKKYTVIYPGALFQ